MILTQFKSECIRPYAASLQVSIRLLSREKIFRTGFTPGSKECRVILCGIKILTLFRPLLFRGFSVFVPEFKGVLAGHPGLFCRK